MSDKIFTNLTALKQKLSTYRPLNPDELQKIRDMERTYHIHTSNALEGNTLTLYETRMILETGVTISGKPLKEHLEVVNLAYAYDFVEEIAKGNQPLGERELLEIHAMVYSKLGERNTVGRYRNVDVWITGSAHTPPSSFQVRELMVDFFAWANQAIETLHPVQYAALLHEKLVTIHPFIDGNGRTARLLLNFALIRHGYLPIYIKSDQESRQRYNKALELAQTTGDTSAFVSLICERVEEKLQERLAILEQANQTHNIN